jgi:hypothetical protein
LRHGRILRGAGTPALGAIIAKMVAEREDIAPYQRRILEERARCPFFCRGARAS